MPRAKVLLAPNLLLEHSLEKRVICSPNYFHNLKYCVFQIALFSVPCGDYLFAGDY